MNKDIYPVLNYTITNAIQFRRCLILPPQNYNSMELLNGQCLHLSFDSSLTKNIILNKQKVVFDFCGKKAVWVS